MIIQKTFIISLPNRLFDRLIPLIDYLKSIGLDYCVFNAIKKDSGVEGLILSVKKILEECIEANYNCIMILEDDCKFIIDPKETIEKCLEQLPRQWDLLYLGCNLWQRHVYKFSENLIQLEDAYATHSIIYSHTGLIKVLKTINEMEGIIPLDILIKEKIMPDGKCFCSFPLVATQAASYSDIEKKEIKYSKLIEDRFEEKTAHLKNNLVD